MVEENQEDRRDSLACPTFFTPNSFMASVGPESSPEPSCHVEKRGSSLKNLSQTQKYLIPS